MIRKTRREEEKEAEEEEQQQQQAAVYVYVGIMCAGILLSVEPFCRFFVTNFAQMDSSNRTPIKRHLADTTTTLLLLLLLLSSFIIFQMRDDSLDETRKKKIGVIPHNMIFREISRTGTF